MKLSQNGRREIVADADAGSDRIDAGCRYQEDKHFTPAAIHSLLPAMAISQVENNPFRVTTTALLAISERYRIDDCGPDIARHCRKHQSNERGIPAIDQTTTSQTFPNRN